VCESTLLRLNWFNCAIKEPGTFNLFALILLPIRHSSINLALKRDRAAEKLTTEELDLAQQRAAKLFEEIQQKKLN
jgi:hypothetical protein